MVRLLNGRSVLPLLPFFLHQFTLVSAQESKKQQVGILVGVTVVVLLVVVLLAAGALLYLRRRWRTEDAHVSESKDEEKVAERDTDGSSSSGRAESDGHSSDTAEGKSTAAVAETSSRTPPTSRPSSPLRDPRRTSVASKRSNPTSLHSRHSSLVSSPLASKPTTAVEAATSPLRHSIVLSSDLPSLDVAPPTAHVVAPVAVAEARSPTPELDFAAPPATFFVPPITATDSTSASPQTEPEADPHAKSPEIWHNAPTTQTLVSGSPDTSPATDRHILDEPRLSVEHLGSTSPAPERTPLEEPLTAPVHSTSTTPTTSPSATDTSEQPPTGTLHHPQ